MIKGDYETSEKAKRYETKRFSDGLSAVSQDELNLLKRFLKNVETNKVYLDLGTGTGRVLSVTTKLNPKKIYAVDASQAMLERLQKAYKSKKIKTINTKADKTTLKQSSVDVATSFHLFKHLEKPEKVIVEVSRVLKTDGLFAFDVLNKNSIINLNLGSCYSVNYSSINQMLTKNHLRILQVTYLHFLGETVYKMLGLANIKLVRDMDYFISNKLKIGTKIFILAEKE